MWCFRAVAFDLDGTLASEDVVSAAVVAAIDAARADRAAVLVTDGPDERGSGSGLPGPDVAF